MKSLKILENTWAKQSTVAAKELADDKKFFLKAGVEFEIDKYSPTASGHIKAVPTKQLGKYQTWCFFEDHVQINDSDKPKDILLKVPYYSQRDNVAEWWRTCNTSSCAMVAEFLKPGCIKSSDDYYLQNYVNQYGDTTDHSAQTAALKALGIDSYFSYNLDYEDIDKELEAGRPVVLGVLHKGTINQPSGGHMVVCVGKYADGYVFNDPWGEGFDYSSTNGKAVKYGFKSLNARWLADGEGTGWGRIFRG